MGGQGIEKFLDLCFQRFTIELLGGQKQGGYVGLPKCVMRVQEKAHQNEDEFERGPGSDE